LEALEWKISYRKANWMQSTRIGFEVKASVVVSFCLERRRRNTFIDEGIPSFTTRKQNYIITKVKINSKRYITVVSADHGSRSRAKQQQCKADA
jgi:hypothetical protein